MDNSILDQIMDKQKQSVLNDFKPDILLQELMQLLEEREREVLDLRYGFSADQKHTLEDIGKKFSITRERVRQIETAAVNKLKNSVKFKEKKAELVGLVEQVLDDVGGIMAEHKLFSHLKEVATNDKVESAIHFLMNKLLAEHFSLIKNNNKLLKSWATKSAAVENHQQVLGQIEEILQTINQILNLNELHQELHKNKDFLAEQKPIKHNIFENLLQASAQIEQNPFGHWGLKHWPLITPKRMNDKIYLVLKNHQQPLHFTEIAAKINEVNFDHKKAHPATVHNELILDNDRYVLIGRGIYALKEWGYKAGVVTDIIQDILKEKGPLTKDEIIAEVLKQRMVKKSTIVLMLTNKQLFKKLSDHRYDLASR